jgi:toxin ParE1/3/4
MKDYELHPLIEEDLGNIFDFIAKDDPPSAERVVVSINKTFPNLALFPESGTPFRARRLPGLRKYQVPDYRNYLVFYRETETAVRILYVFHAARNLKKAINQSQRH